MTPLRPLSATAREFGLDPFTALRLADEHAYDIMQRRAAMARLPRPHMSLSVKLAACLDALGFEPGEPIDWDHTWALSLRPRTPDGGYDPPANDPRYIRPKRPDAHDVKTFGSGATTAGTDIGNARHFRDLTASEEEFRRRMLAKEPGKPREKSGRIPSRPFSQWRPG